jgi:hypothetical protein
LSFLFIWLKSQKKKIAKKKASKKLRSALSLT